MKNKHWLKILLNPWLWAIAFFSVWMIVLDENNMMVQYRRYKQISTLNDKRLFYIREINKTDKQYHELTTNPETQEKFARERYFMKKDNEDVFVIE